MLHSRRTKLANLAVREAAGEVFWTTVFEQALRVKILHLVDRLSNGYSYFNIDARRRIMDEEGMLNLGTSNYDESLDFRQYILKCPDEMMPTVIESWLRSAGKATLQRESDVRTHTDVQFERTIKTLLVEHRVSFDIINEEMVPLNSLELHASVIEPTLRLISSSGSWSTVEVPYMKALREISSNNPDDAITDAGTALQALLTSLGCTGTTLGPSIKSARQKGLLGPHDNPMLEGIEKILHWVSAERSNNGDSHKTSSASSEDAWFIIHIVGAIILRLTGNSPRE